MAGRPSAAVVMPQEYGSERGVARPQVLADSRQRWLVEENDALLLTLAADERAIGPAILDLDTVEARHLLAAHAGAEQRQEQGTVAQHFQTLYPAPFGRGRQWDIKHVGDEQRQARVDARRAVA